MSQITFATADLSDQHPHCPILEPIFSDFGGRDFFYGEIKIIKLFEDNQLLKETLQTKGEGRVLVVDGGGSLRCALLGGTLAGLAETNGWAGLLLYGCVRDVEELAQTDIGIKALASHPRRSQKGMHSGQEDVAVYFGGIHFQPGQWMYSDADGTLISSQPL